MTLFFGSCVRVPGLVLWPFSCQCFKHADIFIFSSLLWSLCQAVLHISADNKTINICFPGSAPHKAWALMRKLDLAAANESFVFDVETLGPSHKLDVWLKS